jgi:ribosome recycling factor
MEAKVIFDELKQRMEHVLEVLSRELKGLRTGRASANLLDPIKVDCYGTRTPLSQIGTVSVPDSRMLSVQVWDKSNVKAIEKAIAEAGLGLNPAVDGTLIRIPIPALNEERRQELSKVAARYAEESRIAIRNVRRDGMETFKKQEKDKVISKDDLERHSKEVQKLTDDHIVLIDGHLEQKQKEIMSV